MYEESKMASWTGQKTREFYYAKQVFGHFRRFKASNAAWSKFFLKNDTNAEILDAKWEKCAQFLPKYRSSKISWSGQVDSDGLSHGFMDFKYFDFQLVLLIWKGILTIDVFYLI